MTKYWMPDAGYRMLVSMFSKSKSGLGIGKKRLLRRYASCNDKENQGRG